MQRGDLGLAQTPGSRQLQCPLGHPRRLGRITFDPVERQLRQHERVEIGRHPHNLYVSPRVRRARVVHRIYSPWGSPEREDLDSERNAKRPTGA